MKIRRQITPRIYKRFKTISLAAVLILGTSYLKENFIADIVDSMNTPNDEYDGFLPFVMAGDDPSADTEVAQNTTWNDKTYQQYNRI
jgi:hypothetical protein